MNFKKWFTENKSTTIPNQIMFGEKWELVQFAHRMSIGFVYFDNEPSKAVQVLQNAFTAFDERHYNEKVWCNQGCTCPCAEYLVDYAAMLGFTKEAAGMKTCGVFCREGSGGYYNRTWIGNGDAVREHTPEEIAQHIRYFLEGVARLDAKENEE